MCLMGPSCLVSLCNDFFSWQLPFFFLFDKVYRWIFCGDYYVSSLYFLLNVLVCLRTCCPSCPPFFIGFCLLALVCTDPSLFLYPSSFFFSKYTLLVVVDVPLRAIVCRCRYLLVACSDVHGCMYWYVIVECASVHWLYVSLCIHHMQCCVIAPYADRHLLHASP